MVEITITSLTPSRFYNCPKPKPGLPMSYVIRHGLFVFNDFRGEVVVRYADIGGILDNLRKTIRMIFFLKFYNLYSLSRKHIQFNYTIYLVT